MSAWRAAGIDGWLPFLPAARAYSVRDLRHDLVAGLTVALFAIPQAMAYALIAGMPPAAGIWSAAAASVLGAAFGSSAFVVDGPTNAMSVMLAANLALLASGGDPVAMTVALTLGIGLGQLAAAALGLGSLTRFVSEPVLTGFTAGAGLYIAVNQLPALFGIEHASLVRDLGGWTLPHNVVSDLVRALMSLEHLNGVALATGLATFALVRGLQWCEPRLRRRLPAPFVAVAVVTLASWLLDLGGRGDLTLVRDIEPLRRMLPRPAWPGVDADSARALLGPALAIGTLGAVEAIAIGKALAARVGHPFDANRQLVGEGACNLAAGLVGGFASSGSFTRSMVNFESGAATRFAAIYSGVLIAGIVLLFAPAANYVPVAALAGTLIHIGLRLVDVSRLRQIAQVTGADRTVLLVTFGGVLLLEHLQYALFAGIAFAISFALRRAEGVKMSILEEDGRGGLIERPLDHAPGREVIALEVQGELFFAAAEELERRLKEIVRGGARFLVVRLSHAYNFDATGVEALAQVADEARARGGRLLLAGVRAGLLGTLERAGVLDRIGRDGVFEQDPELLGATRRAIARAHALAEGNAR